MSTQIKKLWLSEVVKAIGRTIAVVAIIAATLAGCAYNTHTLKTENLTGPVVQLADKSEFEIPDDPVFSAGLLNDQFVKNGKFTVLLAKMPGPLIAEFLKDSRGAGHHGAAYDSKTGKSYPIQTLYAGKLGGMQGVPCGRYLAVVVEGLRDTGGEDVTNNNDIRVIFGNTRGQRFFNLFGQQVPFSPEDYLAGKWESVAKYGTPIKQAPAIYDHGEFMAALKTWSLYEIADVGSDKKWEILTPYRQQQGERNKIRELAGLNPDYSVSDKVRTASKGVIIPLSPDYISFGVSVAVAAIHAPFIEGEDKAIRPDDLAGIAERLDSESGACISPMVPVPKAMADQLPSPAQYP